MVDKESPVKELVSDADKNSNDPSGEGENRDKELESKRIENLRKEYERKMREQVDSVRKDLEKSFEEKMNNRISELENKNKLSSSEDTELKKLNFLKDHPDSKAWRMFMREVFDDGIKTFQQTQAKEDYEEALDIVKEYAEDNSLELSKFKEEINEIIPIIKARTESNRPTKLVKFAIKQWKKEQEKSKLLREAEDIKKNKKEFAEVGGRISRKSTIGEDFSKAKDSNDWSNVLDKTLGEIK